MKTRNKRAEKNLLLIVAGLALAIASGCEPPEPVVRPSAPPPLDEPTKSEQLPAEAAAPSAATEPNIELVQVDYAGFQSQLKKLAGKFIVVDVWSTGCPPCMKEYPNLVALSQRWPDKVACVSYNVDYIGQKSKPVETYLPKVSGFLEKQKSTSVINLISTEADSDVFEKLEIASIPVVMLFDREGKLVKKFTEANGGDDGLTYEGDIVPAIEAAMK